MSMAVRKIVQAKKDVDPNWDYCGVNLTIHNIIIPEERLNPTPSQLDNLDWESEIDLRIVGCELIQDSGVLLRLPQVAMATAQVIYQRFYYSKSFVRHFYEHYAMACVFLSAKLEECPRRIRDVINVFNHIRQVREKKTSAPIMLDQNYINLKNQVIKAERRVLKELGFCVHAKHPHKLVICYLQALDHQNNRELVQIAWNYMNDSLRTDIFVRYLPEAIACGCIYLASCKLNIPLPRNPAWWEMFYVSDESVHEIALCLLRLYARPKPDVAVLENRLAKLRKDQLEIKERECEKRKVAHAVGVPSIGSDHSSDCVSPPTIAKNVSVTTLSKQKSIKHLISTITSTNNSKLNNNLNNAFLVHSEVKAVSINLKSQPPDESGTCIDSGEVEMDVSDQETAPIKSANINTLGDKHKKSPNCETNRHVPVSSESQVRPAAYSNIQSRFNEKVNNKEKSFKRRRSISDSSSSGSDRQKRENIGMNGQTRHYRRRGRNPSDQSSSAPDSELDKHRDASQFENRKYDKKHKRKHVSRSSTDASRHSSSDSDDSRMNIIKRRNGSHSRSRQYPSSYRSRRSHKSKHRSSKSHQDGSSISTNDDYSRSRVSSNRHVRHRK